MLVLTRLQNEKIVIGDNIVVTVLGIHGTRVRLGVEAPRETPVHRHEIWLETEAAEKNKSLAELISNLYKGQLPP